VLAVVTEYGTELKYTSKVLRHDREAVITDVTSDWRAIKFSLAHSHAVLLALHTPPSVWRHGSALALPVKSLLTFESPLCRPASGMDMSFSFFVYNPMVQSNVPN
jgi:hypothetical protein